MQEILLVLGFVAGGFGAPFPGPALGALAVQVSPVPAAGPPKKHVVHRIIGDPLPPHPGCDEVECLIDPGRCGRGCVDPPHHPPAPEPDRLNKDDIIAGMGPVKAKVAACGTALATTGTVRVKMVIEPAGVISSATLMSDAVPALEACIKKAVKTARFRHSGTSLSVIFPFVLR